MAQDHHVGLAGVISSWIMLFGSVALEAEPYIRVLSLILACAASGCAIVYYWSRK